MIYGVSTVCVRERIVVLCAVAIAHTLDEYMIQVTVLLILLAHTFPALHGVRKVHVYCSGSVLTRTSEIWGGDVTNHLY